MRTILPWGEMLVPIALRAMSAVVVLCCGLAASGQEVCDNGYDDDGNGLIDLNDATGCPCDPVVALPSLLANGSFEDNTCCPAGVSMSPMDYLSCATGWVDLVDATTVDYYNPCGFFPGSVPTPLPGGSSAIGMGIAAWPGGSMYEYIAQCLPVPMVMGGTYEMGFNVASVRKFLGTFADITYPINYGPVDLAIYGMATCPPLPNTAGTVESCATDLGWVELAHVTYTPQLYWEQVSFSFTAPFDIQAVAFGPTCPTPSDYTMGNQSWPYFFFDEMTLEPVVQTIDDAGSVCTSDLVLTAVPYDASTGQYQWYLDGVALVGQTGMTLSVSALGLSEGTYQLRVINGTDCVLAEHVVDVEWPQPDLLAAPLAGCVPLEVSFTNTTTTPIAFAAWDFGDGGTASTSDAVHTYGMPGVYDVQLSITSPEGCTKDTLFADLIEVFAVPTAAFMIDTAMGCPGLLVSLESTSVFPEALLCTWALGDGTVLTGNAVQHVYTTPGVYDVGLTVGTANGCTDDSVRHAVVEILPVPVPAFSADPMQGCVPLQVDFDNLTTDAALLQAEWDMGNGTTATTTDASTTYAVPGDHVVLLTMTNALGCSASVQQVVTGYPIPVPLFTVVPDSGCAPLAVLFEQQTDPTSIGACMWTMGDGTYTSMCEPEHVYGTPGRYDVSLSLTSPFGCMGDTTLEDAVLVLPSPVASFGMGPQPTNLYATEITFTDGSSADVVAWHWSFTAGEPGSSTAPSPVVRFPFGVVDDYPVILTVQNNSGCTDTAMAVVRIDGIFSVYVPNSFTPDGDGFNDLFAPVVMDADAQGYQFMVFDRWGEVVFASTRSGEGWDGRVDGAEPKTDVYVWRIVVGSANDATRVEHFGHVTVLR